MSSKKQKGKVKLPRKVPKRHSTVTLTSSGKKGKPPHWRARRRLLARMRELYEFCLANHRFLPDFVSAAKKLMPEEAGKPRFSFVLMNLWRNWEGMPPDGWEQVLAKKYHRFVKEFEWMPDGTPKRFSQELIDETLAHWQPRDTRRLTAKDAVGILMNTEQFAKAVREMK